MEIVETLVKDSQILININTKKTEKKKITIAWFLGTLAGTLDASVLGNMSTGDSCQLSPMNIVESSELAKDPSKLDNILDATFFL